MVYIGLMLSRYLQIVRFLISGGSATAVIIALLYVLTDILHIWYLASFVIAFLFGVAVSFILQKFWTFKDKRNTVWIKQASLYLGIQLWDLVLNTVLLYILVERFHMWYLGAQIILSFCIAIQNFALYRILVFKEDVTGSLL